MSKTKKVLVASLVVAALASTRSRTDVIDALASGEATPELAAMILTPQDLERAGMGEFPVYQVGGNFQSPMDVNEGFVRAHGISAERGWEVFVESGLQQRYGYSYLLKYPNDTDPSTSEYRRVESSVFRFDDDQSATVAFDPLSSVLARDAPAINAGIVPIGDNSKLSRAEVPLSNGEGTYPELTLTLRTGNIIASVSISDALNEPDLAAVDILARQLWGRIVAVSTTSGPGLSDLVLRFDEPWYYVDNFDGYILASGGVFVGSESSTDIFKPIEAPAADLAGAFDGYQVSYHLHSGFGEIEGNAAILLYKFRDETRAADYVLSLPSALDSTDAQSLDVTNLPGIGDRAFVATYDESSETDQKQQIAAVQVGPYVSIAYGPEKFADQTRDLLADQVSCLKQSGCPTEETNLALAAV